MVDCADDASVSLCNYFAALQSRFLRCNCWFLFYFSPYIQCDVVIVGGKNEYISCFWKCRLIIFWVINELFPWLSSALQISSKCPRGGSGLWNFCDSSNLVNKSRCIARWALPWVSVHRLSEVSSLWLGQQRPRGFSCEAIMQHFFLQTTSLHTNVIVH